MFKVKSEELIMYINKSTRIEQENKEGSKYLEMLMSNLKDTIAELNMERDSHSLLLMESHSSEREEGSPSHNFIFTLKKQLYEERKAHEQTMRHLKEEQHAVTLCKATIDQLCNKIKVLIFI